MPLPGLCVSHKTATTLLTLSVSAALLPVLLTGCGAGPVDHSVSPSRLVLRGLVHGGQQPVGQSIIGLYKAGQSGLASLATDKLTSAVMSNDQGGFMLDTLYHCDNSSDQMYLTATQGNPGSSSNNPALTLVAALGNCGDLNSGTFIIINEVTTAAAAWGLAQFATDYTHIGATATNATGIANAFAGVQQIATTSTGLAAQLPSGLTGEPDKLYALADALASCVNSDGTTGCAGLFAAATPPGGSAPTDTFTAALNIVKNPSNNVGDVWNTINGQAPFPTALTQPPNEWTMSLTTSGGGIGMPTRVAVDKEGNAWVANFYGALSEFSPNGVPLSGSGYGLGTLSEDYGLAIDTSDNIWVSVLESPVRPDSTKGSVVKFSGARSATPGTVLATYTATLDYPEGLFADSNGNIDIANEANASATILAQDGTVVHSGLGNAVANEPVVVFPDASHGVWLGYPSSGVISDAPIGSAAYNVSCCDSANGIYGDNTGSIWTANYGSDSVSLVKPSGSGSGTVTLNQKTGGGLSGPSAVVVDSAQNAWLSNFHGASFSAIAGQAQTAVALGAPLSPDAGWGKDATLLQPSSLALDAAGNVWITSQGTNTLVKFYGMAAPTVSPFQNVPVAP